MSTEYDNGVVGYFIELIDKNSAPIPEVINDKAVVDNLMTHINRTPKHLKCAIDNINGAIDTGAEATWISQQYVHIYRLLISYRTLQCSSATSTLCIATRKDNVRPAKG